MLLPIVILDAIPDPGHTIPPEPPMLPVHRIVLHVDPQVWAGVVPRAVNGAELTATFKETSKLEFQDALGLSLAALLEVVPDGVLLFAPSYHLLDKLCARWQVGSGGRGARWVVVAGCGLREGVLGTEQCGRWQVGGGGEGRVDNGVTWKCGWCCGSV